MLKNRSSSNKKIPAYPFIIVSLLLFWFAIESVGRATFHCQRQESAMVNCRLTQTYRLGLLARQPEMLADVQTIKLQKEEQKSLRRRDATTYAVIALTTDGKHELPFSIDLPWAFDQFLHSHQTEWHFTEFNWLAGLLFGLFAVVFAGAGVVVLRNGGKSSFSYELAGTGPYKVVAGLLLIVALALLLAAIESMGRSTIHCQPPDSVDRSCRIDETHWLGLVVSEPELLYAVQSFSRPASRIINLNRRRHTLSFRTILNPPVMVSTPIGERPLPFSANLADEFAQLQPTTDSKWTYTEIQWLSGLLIALVASLFGMVGLLVVKHLNTATKLVATKPVEERPTLVKTNRRGRKR